MLVIIGAPLALASLQVTVKSILETPVQADAGRLGEEAGWRVETVTATAGRIDIRVEGPLPAPDTERPQDPPRATSDIDLSHRARDPRAGEDGGPAD